MVLSVLIQVVRGIVYMAGNSSNELGSRMTSTNKIICNDELFEYETRMYYYCNRVKGHRGRHSHLSLTRWNNKK